MKRNEKQTFMYETETSNLRKYCKYSIKQSLYEPYKIVLDSQQKKVFKMKNNTSFIQTRIKIVKLNKQNNTNPCKKRGKSM